MTENGLFQGGDVVLVNLDPILGSEQAGIRPGIIISCAVMREVSKRIIVCPITRNMAPWPTKVQIPSGFKTRGMVLADQVRSVDHEARVLRHVETLPGDFVALVRSYVGRMIELEVPSRSV